MKVLFPRLSVTSLSALKTQKTKKNSPDKAFVRPMTGQLSGILYGACWLLFHYKITFSFTVYCLVCMNTFITFSQITYSNIAKSNKYCATLTGQMTGSSRVTFRWSHDHLKFSKKSLHVFWGNFWYWNYFFLEDRLLEENQQACLSKVSCEILSGPCLACDKHTVKLTYHHVYIWNKWSGLGISPFCTRLMRFGAAAVLPGSPFVRVF